MRKETIPTPSTEELEDLKARPDVKKVLEDPKFFQHEKIYRLHKLNLNNKQIEKLIGCNHNNVCRALWRYENGKNAKPF